MDSEEHIEKQLKQQRDKWRFAISQLTKETLQSTENLDDDKEVSSHQDLTSIAPELNLAEN